MDMSTNQALVLMDLQIEILPRLGDKAPAVLANAASALAAARTAGMTVIHVVVGFRAGYPEVSPRNASFSMVAKMGGMIVTTPGANIAPQIKPREDEPVVVKHRVSAFAGTDLEMILRARGVTKLALCGIATSGVVLSTLRHAADADYECTVIADACADGDDEVHRVLTEKVFPRQATVIATADFR
jgi:nicotinamidase-related amidase